MAGDKPLSNVAIIGTGARCQLGRTLSGKGFGVEAIDIAPTGGYQKQNDQGKATGLDVGSSVTQAGGTTRTTAILPRGVTVIDLIRHVSSARSPIA